MAAESHDLCVLRRTARVLQSLDAGVVVVDDADRPNSMVALPSDICRIAALLLQLLLLLSSSSVHFMFCVTAAIAVNAHRIICALCVCVCVEWRRRRCCAASHNSNISSTSLCASLFENERSRVTCVRRDVVEHASQRCEALSGTNVHRVFELHSGRHAASLYTCSVQQPTIALQTCRRRHRRLHH